VRRACDLAIKNGQVAAGIFATGESQTVMGNSRGLFRRVSRDARRVFYHHAGRCGDELGQGQFRRREGFSIRKSSPRARATKAHRALDPREVAPGRYTVILEPSAVLDLVGFLFYDFAATALADKRSCLNDRLGKPLFGKNISITDDAYHPLQLGANFDGEGMPRQRVTLVDRGVPRNLVYSRRSAKAAHKTPTGHGFALPNEYGEAPMESGFRGRQLLDR